MRLSAFSMTSAFGESTRSARGGRDRYLLRCWKCSPSRLRRRWRNTVEHVWPSFAQFLGKSKDVVVFMSAPVLRKWSTRGGSVHFSATIRGLVRGRAGRMCRRSTRRSTDFTSLFAAHAADGINHSFSSARARSATSADDSYSVVHDEVLVVFRQFLGRKFVDRVSTFILRSPALGRSKYAWSNSTRDSERHHHLGPGPVAPNSNPITSTSKGSEARGGCSNFSAEQNWCPTPWSSFHPRHLQPVTGTSDP